MLSGAVDFFIFRQPISHLFNERVEQLLPLECELRPQPAQPWVANYNVKRMPVRPGCNCFACSGTVFQEVAEHIVDHRTNVFHLPSAPLGIYATHYVIRNGVRGGREATRSIAYYLAGLWGRYTSEKSPLIS